MKLFAIIKDEKIVDGWVASSIEEAIKDNPESTVIECTKENSPWKLYGKYEVKNV